MVNTVKKPTGWGLIILCFIILWPIGLILLIKRLSVDKTATFQSGRTITIVSYVLMGMGVLYLLITISGNPAMLTLALLFGGGGVLVNRFALKTQHTGERYKKYITLIVNHGNTSIDTIAASVGVQYDVALADLQKMITAGYFVGAYIDTMQRQIILAKSAPIHPHATANPFPFSAPAQERVVNCESCGANNRIFVQIGECEYCGSPLQ